MRKRPEVLKMRTVSFVDNIEFEYSGNISPKALTLGDIDNDKVRI